MSDQSPAARANSALETWVEGWDGAPASHTVTSLHDGVGMSVRLDSGCSVD